MYENELYHYGVKGMRWGHRKSYPTTSAGYPTKSTVGAARVRMKESKKAYKQANKDYNKSFKKAHRYTYNHPIASSIRKKKTTNLWGDAYEKGNTANKAKDSYKQSKQNYKAEKKAYANTPEAKAARSKRIKTAAAVGAAAAGTALAAYGAYKMTKRWKMANQGLMNRGIGYTQRAQTLLLREFNPIDAEYTVRYR